MSEVQFGILGMADYNDYEGRVSHSHLDPNLNSSHMGKLGCFNKQLS